MTRPYFLLPAENDASRLYDAAKAERSTDFMRGVVCGVSLAAVAFSLISAAVFAASLT